MSAKQFIAFDLGAESGRSILGTLDSGRLSLRETHRFANPMGKIARHLHWNLLGQWEELKTGLRKSAEGKQIDGVGVDAWGVDFGLVAKNGQILANPRMYRDADPAVMRRTFRRLSREKIFRATGIQFMRFNSLYQLIALKEEKSASLESAESLLFMPDLFNYLFSGEARSEISIASTSQMYDPTAGAWAKGMLRRLNLPTDILPKIVPSGTVLGDLLDDVAEECGVKPAPIIAPGCHDTASAVAAVPARDGDWCYISSGTWSLMGVELDKPNLSGKALKYNYTNEIGVGGKIRFLKNIMGLWLVQECRRYWQKEGKNYDYGQLTTMAEEARPFAAVINPDDEPFGSPGDMPIKIERFCVKTGQRPPLERGQVVRVCLEGLALVYRRTLAALEDMMGRRIETIYIVGGGSRNELLNQMTADACGRAVVAGPVEATAIGNLLTQAGGVGEVKNLTGARGIVRESFEVKRYEPRGGGKWDAAYARFEEMIGGR